MPVCRATNDGWPSNVMPACAIEVSCCGAATTASTSPAIAAFTAAAQNAIEARPLTGLTTPKPSDAVSGCGEASRLICEKSTLIPQDLAWRSSKAGSQTNIGSQAARTTGSSAALSAISGPMPAGSPTGIAILSLPLMSLPWHQRSVDHVRHAFVADRADREVDVLQAEFVRGDQLQRESLRRDLLECQLAGLVAVAAGALHGDKLHREFLQREVRELAEFALRHDDAGLALERLDAEQDRNGTGAGGAVERHVNALAAGDLHDAGERVFLGHVDDVIGTELLGDFES